VLRSVVAKTINQRELRNSSGKIMRALDRERFRRDLDTVVDQDPSPRA
jgi:hypothetical protein